MKFKPSAAFTFLIILSIVVLCIEKRVFGQSAADFDNIVKQYTNETKAIAAKGDRTALKQAYEYWLAEFLRISGATKSKEVRDAALAHAASLANGLGNYRLSRELNETRLSEQTDWQSQLRSNTELGEVERLAYSADKKPETLDSSLKHFCTAAKIASENMKTVAQSPGLARDVAVATNYAARILLQKNDAASMTQAADLSATGRQLLLTMTDLTMTKTLEEMGFELSVFVEDEVVAAARAGDLKRAYAVLDEVAKDPNNKKPLSQYFDRMIRAAYPKGGSDYWDAVQTWLKQKPEDAYTPFVIFRLAGDYYSKDQFLKAIPLYEVLLDKYRNVFLERDRSSAEPQSGGYLAEIIFNLAQCYSLLEHFERAEVLLAQFVSAYPKDPRARFANEYFTRISKSNKQEDRTHLSDVMNAKVVPAISPEPIKAIESPPVPAAETKFNFWIWIASAVAIGSVFVVILQRRKQA
jgi:hypothetical protein